MECSYRPFCVTNLYYSPSLIESPGQCKDLFPLNTDRIILCVNGKGSNKDASTIVTHYIPDYQLQFNCQFYPLYWYEEKQESPKKKQITVKPKGFKNFIAKN